MICTQCLKSPNTLQFTLPLAVPQLTPFTNSPPSILNPLINQTQLIPVRPFKTIISSIFVRQSNLTVYYEIVKPAIEMATEQCNRRFEGYLHVQSNILNDSRHCFYTVAASLAAEQYYMYGTHAFIGPACIFALDNVARMASYWNIPIFTAGGSSVEFNDKTLFTTLSRLSFSLGK